MIKKILLILVFICPFGIKAYAQDIPRLIKIYEEMVVYEEDENFKEVLRLANILVDRAPMDSELHLLGYTSKAYAENKLGDYRNAIISASKALELNTKIALMIRQADLPVSLKKAKSLLYLIRGLAKDSIGLIESSEADFNKSKELKQ